MCPYRQQAMHAYEKLCRGKFSASTRVSAFLFDSRFQRVLSCFVVGQFGNYWKAE